MRGLGWWIWGLLGGEDGTVGWVVRCHGVPLLGFGWVDFGDERQMNGRVLWI